MRKPALPLIIAASLALSSCLVSRKKYEIAEAGRYGALYSRDSLADLLEGSRIDVANLSAHLEAMLQDTTNLRDAIRQYQAMLNTNLSENQKLNASLSEREKTIRQLEGIINEQNQKVKNLLGSVKDALLGFSSEDLSVREEGGKVYVAMSDKLLFESGKAVVNELGRNALGKLAEVLNRQTDIDVYIEGHTDSKPIKTAIYKDNWDLSVIRATSVVRILTEVYGVSPMQIQPCGRGEFKPIDDNNTAEGRARNRRTEIIMAPKLDKLFQMLQE
ncbi:MAG: OmpA family protein [Bacteroidaceae bacterium]|jgi:chemotaxis protein MotB|nr:OmpA family protein [Bacteroidaceae bacterium]